MSKASPLQLQAFRRTISLQRVNFGETLSIGGTYLPFLVTGGGLIASEHRSNYSILCD
jgi:acyl-CoA hydrolase